jgi:uncharacterized membrane protein
LHRPRSPILLQPRRTSGRDEEATMHSRAKIAGHPIHPMLIVFPLGLLATSFFFDLIYLGTRNTGWSQASFYMIAAGVIGGLGAAVFGLVDWLGIPSGTRAKFIGAWHGLGNVVVTGLFVVSWLMRFNDPTRPSSTAIILSLISVFLALVTGWLGGELVDRMGVGVDEGAHLDSPSSLGHEPASSHARKVGQLREREVHP